MAAGTGEGLKLVRADLCGRLDRLEAGLAARGSIGVASDAGIIASLAGEYGMIPTQRLAEGLAVALGSGGRGAAIGPWIERLRDSIGCEAVDESGGDNWLASVMVRLAG
ncbi:hypothetical protein [Sphingomonas oligoaromativorans]|uniref:hypothetical protein n=1 Tax=Sphingomonas oligoaromativorans TaxID=575322 RepID=UPI00142191C7|nr:hypothetical protein [Sphingomonas oligoaromativorans]NIJ33059.1 hypothetical protein [Sphingomonas oligoaromativorans]